jgi:hypothetical protein
MTSAGIQRAFFDLSEKDVDDVENAALIERSWFGKASGWNDVLKSRRILLIAEAQSGKTYECQTQQQMLWKAGEPAFFIDLSSVASQPWRELRSPDETERLERWRRTETDFATIFLDSLDELRLTQGKFHTALRNVANDLHGHTGRVRIVLTSRPLPVDRKLFLRTFEAPPIPAQSLEDSFAALATGALREEKHDQLPDIRYVSFLPLDAEDVKKLAAGRNINDASDFLSALRESNMLEFMRRPQDVIEAVSAWKELGGRFGTHAEQVAFDIRARLKPNPDRPDRQLEDDRALEGAKRLALAVVLSRRLTIRHDVNSDVGDASTVVDPVVILNDWRDGDRRALLERGLFGFASYGRVRFHNRLAFEFLAAWHLDDLIEKGMSRKAVRRLLVVRTAQGLDVIRPSRRDVAAWLALRQSWVFDLANDLDPALLMSLGDPGSLPVERRQTMLKTYIERFGNGGWRGLSVPRIQIHRLADSSFWPMVREQFDIVENPEVRRVLLDLIGHAHLRDCADIARRVVWDSRFDQYERIRALDALVALNDIDLAEIAKQLCSPDGHWDHAFARSAISRLFPQHMTVDQLTAALGWVSETDDIGSALSRILPPQIERLPLEQIEKLRQGLAPLVGVGLAFDANTHRARTQRPHLARLLAATCTRLLNAPTLPPAAAASVALAAALMDRDGSSDEILSMLLKAVASASPAVRAAIFEEDIALQRRLRPDVPRLRLFSEWIGHKPFHLKLDDRVWMKQSLADRQKSADVRAAALLAEIFVFMANNADRQAHLVALTPLVADDQELMGQLEGYLLAPVSVPETQQWQLQHEQTQRERARREAEVKASWIKFREELRGDPDAAFSREHAEHTVYDLCRFMARAEAPTRSSGWNRRLIEEYFGQHVADRLRNELIRIWRKEKPPLASECPEAERKTHFARWYCALVAIHAEAEDPEWAARLSPRDAEIAARYAEKNGTNFPAWLDALAVAHPQVVERVIGQEVSSILSSPATDAKWHSIVLQNILYASPDVARLFLPRLRTWLQATAGVAGTADGAGSSAKKLEQVIGILLKFGAEADLRAVGEVASATLDQDPGESLVHVLLPALFATDPEKAVARLETICSDADVSQSSQNADWFARLFGRIHLGEGVNLKHPAMTPALLLRLLRLAYRHVDPGKDAVHRGVYTPDMRDHAEQERKMLLSAVIELGGSEGWKAKHEIADDPAFGHLRDRMRLLAIEKAARESDGEAMRLEDIVKLTARQEPGPRSAAEMFALIMDRLDDLRDHLLSDSSPRKLWQSVQDEHDMRRAIAGHLESRACGAYTIAQESVTADEKETDIRLRSTANGVEGVIELKIGDKDYSGNDLRAAISQQLVRKYLAPDNRRAGCLVITLSQQKGWRHPDTGNHLDFGRLIDMLQAAATDLQRSFPDEIHVDVFGLDLRPRLPTERVAATATPSVSDDVLPDLRESHISKGVDTDSASLLPLPSREGVGGRGSARHDG